MLARRTQFTSAKAPTPSHLVFFVNDGSPVVQLQLDPIDFAGVMNGLSEGRELRVNLSDFLFNPLLVTEDGLKALEHFYWVPYNEPFKDIYNHLRDKTGDAYHLLPEANYSFMGQSLQEEEEEKEFVDEVPTEDMTTTLFNQIMVTNNQQQKMLMNLRHSAGFGNFLLFLILSWLQTYWVAQTEIFR